MACYEDDRQLTARFAKLLLEVETAKATREFRRSLGL